MLIAATIVDGAYAMGWGTLALLTAGIAQGKNRSVLVWFLFTLLLGRVATFFLVAFFPKLPSDYDPQISDG